MSYGRYITFHVNIDMYITNDFLISFQIRTEYLSLAQLMIKNSDYREHQHRRAELHACVNRIGVEEDIESQMDRLIVFEIWKDFPEMFPKPQT